ncbi:MAG TPA: metalloregulator ArsR/SmtB family transcription factor [Planctomycetota bacterium]|nr:metalloregulator ArsR/SmtB family transcription factor [Planctomycetota bacterium]
MDTEVAVAALGALAHDSRLRVFRMLVRKGPEGVAPGEISEQLGIPGSTLSFHLRHLVHAGLIRPERRGRSLLYTLRAEKLSELLWFLGEDCCQGRTELCAPLTARIDARLQETLRDERRPKVLFLCSRNSARSQMAEAILRHEAPDRVEAVSGGIRPERIDPLTFRVLEEARIPTDGLEAKDLGRFLGKVPIHYAIVVCETAHEQCPRIWPFAQTLLYWPFPDPVAVRGSEEERLESFRAARDAIAARIRAWLRAEFPGLERERRLRAGREGASSRR